MIHTGLVSATFKKEPCGEVLSLCRKGNLAGIEWSEGHHLEAGNYRAGEELRIATKDAGIEIVALGSYYRLGTEKNYRESFEKRIISAKALGTDLIRIWAGTEPSSDVDDHTFASMVEEVRILGAMAEAENIKIAFEWHKNTLTDTNESGLRLMNALADSGNVYSLWQPTVALDETERLKGIELLGPRLANLHVYYWKEGVRRPLEEGRDFWFPYFRRVEKNNDRYALLEFVMGDKVEQFLDDALVLNNWVKQINEEKE